MPEATPGQCPTAAPSESDLESLTARLQTRSMKVRNSLGHLRWAAVPVIAFDTMVTMFGQPKSYWNAPWTGREGNPFFAWFLVRGGTFFLILSACYISGAVLLVSVLPRRFALVVLMSFIFGHYYGAVTWFRHFGFGISAAIVYGVLISLLLVVLGLSTRMEIPASPTPQAVTPPAERESRQP